MFCRGALMRIEKKRAAQMCIRVGVENVEILNAANPALSFSDECDHTECESNQGAGG